MRKRWKNGCFASLLTYLREKKERGEDEVTMAELYNAFKEYSESTIRNVVSELIHRGILEVTTHKRGKRYVRKRGYYKISDEILKIDTANLPYKSDKHGPS